MLQEITLKNFKLFDEEGVTINPSRITVLIGANGTGKSSVLQALLLLKQSVNYSGLKLDGTQATLGSYKDLVHSQDVQQTITVRLALPYRGLSSPMPEPRLPSAGSFTYEVEFNHEGVYRHEAFIGDDNSKLKLFINPDSFSLTLDDENVAGKRIRVNNLIDFVVSGERSVGRPFSITIRTLASGRQKPVADRVANWYQSLISSVANHLAQTYVVPAIRGFDQLAYPSLDELPSPQNLSAAGDAREAAQRAINKIAFEPDFADGISERLNKVFESDGVRLRPRQAPRHKVVTEILRGRQRINLVNEASGPNALIQAFLQLGAVQSGSIIGIEEPEIHLHPKAQAALCGVFVEIATKEDKQLILTTHSEHILMGLLTAVAKGQLKPADLAVYEFRRDGDAARAERLEVNEYGQIDGGLSGFLEVDIEQMGEFIAARFRSPKS